MKKQFHMNVKTYLRDRVSYIVMYFAGISCAIIVMQLDRIISGQKISMENVLYSYAAALFLLAFFMTADYLRKRKIYGILNSMEDCKGNLKDVFKVSSASNNEHELIIKIYKDSFAGYEKELSSYKDKQKENFYFMNEWAHQMKTPLSVIKLILESGRDGIGSEDVKSICEEVQKLSHGMDMIFYNARLMDFKMDFIIQKVDIASVVRDVINSHKKEFIAYSIFPKIESDCDNIAETDKKWIRFVIEQIMTNSIKYSRYKDKDEKRILVSISQSNGLMLSIKDEGVGIPEEDISRVFNPFFTGSNGREFSESTGMGMYLSKLVCDKLGHKISIESVKGEWTKVSILFRNGKSLYDMNMTVL